MTCLLPYFIDSVRWEPAAMNEAKLNDHLDFIIGNAAANGQAVLRLTNATVQPASDPRAFVGFVEILDMIPGWRGDIEYLWQFLDMFPEYAHMNSMELRGMAKTGSQNEIRKRIDALINEYESGNKQKATQSQ